MIDRYPDQYENDLTLEMAYNQRGISYLRLGEYNQAIADQSLSLLEPSMFFL